MHPVIARIHPSIRTALLAWMVARAVIWTSWVSAGNAAPHIDPRGAPTWSYLAELSYSALWVEWIVFCLIELTVPLALVAAYRFARRDTLPQGAEHATWLVAFAPAMAFLLPGDAWTLGICLGLISMGGLIAGQFVMAGVALMAAIAVVPEVCFILPGLFAIGFKTTNESGFRGYWVPVAGLCAFSAAILYPVFFGDPAFFTEGLQRRGDWASLLDEPVTHLALVLCFCIAVVGAYRTRTYRWLWFAPIALVPMMFEPTGSGLAIVMLAAPVIAAAFTVVSEDLGFQRITLMLSAVGLAVLAFV